MKSIRSHAPALLVEGLVLAVFLSVGRWAPSQTITFPTWATTFQGRNDLGSFLPPEYSGAHPGFARKFITHTTPRATSRTWKLQGSVTSGILAFWDRRTSPTTKAGIDTGLSRIYGLQRLLGSPPGTAEFLVSGWDGANGRSALKRVTIPAVGSPTVQTFGPPVPSGQIWVDANVVNGFLYVFDLETLTIRRCHDADGDGVPETLDTEFGYGLDPTESATPFSMFAPCGSGAVALVGKTKGLPRRILTETPAGWVLSVASRTEVAKVLRITGPLHAGQRRIRVLGAPSKSFRIREMTGAVPNGGWISSTYALPRSGHMIIDLDLALAANWKLGIVPSDPEQLVGVPATVATEALAVLFEPLDTECNQGTIVRFEGDGFRNTHEAHCKLDGSDVALTTTYVSATQIAITLPPRGDTSKKPPYSGVEPVMIWLVDTQTGATASDKVYVNLLFAP